MKQRKHFMRRLTALLLTGTMLTASAALAPVLCGTAGLCAAAAETAAPTQEEVYAALMAMQETYPEGTPFTNEITYTWHAEQGYTIRGGGCAAFAFMLSDAAFGDLPARRYYDYNQVRVGDILRINNNPHSVIVTEVHADYVVLAEGNFNGAVHWGSTLTFDRINDGSTSYAITRYPEEKPHSTGDVNGDGEIDAIDAQQALRSYIDRIAGKARKLTDAQLTAADVDKSGVTDARDAQIILQYFVRRLALQDITWDDLI